MPAPSPRLIVKNPPPLNPFTRWPFIIAPFPAVDLLVTAKGAPKENPADAPADPFRKEAR
jgi:hypothetical protein